MEELRENSIQQVIKALENATPEQIYIWTRVFQRFSSKLPVGTFASAACGG